MFTFRNVPKKTNDQIVLQTNVYLEVKIYNADNLCTRFANVIGEIFARKKLLSGLWAIFSMQFETQLMVQ